MERILVVDDEEDVVDILKKQLEKSGYLVNTAYNGREGLNLIQQHSFHLVLTDIVMPDIDGLELCKRLKNNKTTQNIPVVVLTAWGNMEKAFRDLGVADFLLKPFVSETLICKIRELLKRPSPLEPVHHLMVSRKDESVVESIIKKIIHQGFPLNLQVNTFHSQSDILASLHQYHPDAIFLDCLTKNFPLEETIKKLRADSHLNEVPIIIHGHWILPGSGAAQEREGFQLARKAYLEAGANYYLDRFSEFSLLLIMHEFVPHRFRWN